MPRGLQAFGPLVICTLALPAVASAQVRASERAIVSQTVDGTVITVDYSRPAARGRPVLFGGVVRWGDVWTPGANYATTLEVSRDVTVNGQPLATGKYALWMIPRAAGDWTVFLHDNVRAFHTQRPDPSTALLTLMVAPEQVAHTEVLTFSFPAVAHDGTTLRMQWGTTAIPLQIAVEPTRQRRRVGTAAPYVGSYVLKFSGEAGPPVDIQADVFERQGQLMVRTNPAPPDFDPEFELLPSGEHQFQPRYYKGGNILEHDVETLVVFVVENGRASRFELRFGAELYGTAERVNR
jgi:hypothetical protein